jgi:hypothetical protein
MKNYGETHCPYCEKPLAQDEDYDKYQPGEGLHLCWYYRHGDCAEYTKSPEEKLIEVLKQRDMARAEARKLKREKD